MVGALDDRRFWLPNTKNNWPIMTFAFGHLITSMNVTRWPVLDHPGYIQVQPG